MMQLIIGKLNIFQLCEFAEKVFSADHDRYCTKGGFIHLRHDEVEKLLANLAKEVCNDVKIELHHL